MAMKFSENVQNRFKTKVKKFRDPQKCPTKCYLKRNPRGGQFGPPLSNRVNQYLFATNTNIFQKSSVFKTLTLFFRKSAFYFFAKNAEYKAVCFK